MPAQPILESFIHANYPGMNLPPLWQVIYQEAMRGHHLLFRRADIERFEHRAAMQDFNFDAGFSEELETIALKLIGCSDLQAMVRVIDALPDATRESLYLMYRHVLWMWRNYIKERMN